MRPISPRCTCHIWSTLAPDFVVSNSDSSFFPPQKVIHWKESWDLPLRNVLLKAFSHFSCWFSLSLVSCQTGCILYLDFAVWLSIMVTYLKERGPHFSVFLYNISAQNVDCIFEVDSKRFPPFFFLLGIKCFYFAIHVQDLFSFWTSVKIRACYGLYYNSVEVVSSLDRVVHTYIQW